MQTSRYFTVRYCIHINTKVWQKNADGQALGYLEVVLVP